MKKIIEPGKWHAEFDGKGNCIKVIYDESFRKLLGYEVEEEYSNNQNAWLESINPEDRKRVDDYFNECTKKHPEGMDFDVEYRMMTKWGYHWFHDYAHGYRDNTGELRSFDGVVFDIQDSIDKANMEIALSDINARILALEDNFECFYDVEIESGRYTSYIKGDFYQRNVIDKLVSSNDYFEDLRENIDSVIYKEDREELYEVLKRDAIVKGLSKNDHIDKYYRINSDKGPIWFKIRVVYKDKERKHIIIGAFNAEEEMENLSRTKKALDYEQLRNEVLNYLIDNEEDPVELLRHYAGRVREFLNCDQVIYRDLSKTRIMSNSKEIEKTWSVPISYCKKCEHFDAHHEMYSKGFVEMPNCQEGYNGIPVYEKCPIKSSLTRIVYCDGEVAGYLAIHYVEKYHQFTDIERSIIEEFARILSVALSRFEARKKYLDIKSVKEILEESQKANIKLAEQGAFTRFFLEPYQSAYYVGFSNMSCQVYKRTKKLEKEYPILTNYVDSLNEYIDKEVLPEYQDEFKKLIMPATMKKLLKKQPEFNYTFRGYVGKDERCIQFQVIRGADENHAAFGFKDITEEINKQQEEERKLSEALSMAQSANKAKTTFLNNMSHDIRTPMNAIVGYAGLASNHIDDKEKVKDYLSKIEKSSDHLLSLINDVLDMSRIESGKVSIEANEENLFDIIRTLNDIVQSDINSKKLEFMIDMSQVKNEGIFCDRLRLNQVLLNILSNAIKYTAVGGKISLSIKELPSKKEGYGTYEFEIIDNGMGIDKEFLKTIFEPFTRVNSSTVSGIQGTGLGMAITKNIVDMMGGKIDIESELDKGTKILLKFDFKLKKTNENFESFGLKESNSIENSRKNFFGKRVLLVEDNDLNREIASDILTDYGFIVDYSEDGHLAVEKMRNAKEGDYDLILMDILMPTMDGYEATRQIRNLKTEVSKIPIIAMTANAFEEDKEAARLAGMDAHLSKPVEISRLEETLSKFF